MQLNRRTFAHPDVEHFHEHGKAHRKIDVALGNMLAKSVGNEGNPYKQEEAEREHLDSGVTIDKPTDRSGEDHHEDDRHNDCPDHNGNVIDHPNGSNH